MSTYTTEQLEKLLSHMPDVAGTSTIGRSLARTFFWHAYGTVIAISLVVGVAAAIGGAVIVEHQIAQMEKERARAPVIEDAINSNADDEPATASQGIGVDISIGAGVKIDGSVSVGDTEINVDVEKEVTDLIDEVATNVPDLGQNIGVPPIDEIATVIPKIEQNIEVPPIDEIPTVVPKAEQNIDVPPVIDSESDEHTDDNDNIASPDNILPGTVNTPAR